MLPLAYYAAAGVLVDEWLACAEFKDGAPPRRIMYVGDGGIYALTFLRLVPGCRLVNIFCSGWRLLLTSAAAGDLCPMLRLRQYANFAYGCL
jgi:hypothetical protein